MRFHLVAVVLLLAGCGARSELVTPGPPEGDVVSFALGNGWSWALLTNDEVWVWGLDDQGNLDASTLAPQRFTGVNGVVALAAGYGQACAILDGGELACWGNNNVWQAGAGGPDGQVQPVPPTVIASGVSGVGLGESDGCAVRTDGAALCWGSGDSGEIGNVAQVPFAEPMPTVVQGVEGVLAVAPKLYLTCALVAGGDVMCWGQGPLGNGGPALPTATPARVLGLAHPATQIAVAMASACALLSDRTVACWGTGAYGELGLGAGITTAPLPGTVPGLAGVAGISCGNQHCCALLGDGTARCWGSYGIGPSPSWSPSPVPGLAGATAIGSGWYHDCALREDRRLVCWGDNSYGQLGDGSTTPSVTPVLASQVP